MANQYINKVILNGQVKIDLTADSVVPAKLLKGITAHDKTGATITGMCTFDADTSGATASAAEILLGKTAFVKGAEVTGTMPNNGAVAGNITTKAQVYTVPLGFHDGSGTVQIAEADQAKLIATNIREGVTILGVEGTMSGSEDMKAQAKTVTPTFDSQEVLPDEGFNCLSSVTVNAIPVSETDNEAGGVTLTIGA